MNDDRGTLHSTAQQATAACHPTQYETVHSADSMYLFVLHNTSSTNTEHCLDIRNRLVGISDMEFVLRESATGKFHPFIGHEGP